MKELRSLVVKLVIGSFSVAALLGIVALLAGGSFGDTEGQILLTTVIVGVTSVATLCYLSTTDKPFQALGLIGGITVLIPSSLALWFTWGGNEFGGTWQTFGIGVTVSASIAQACLLLSLAFDSRQAVRQLLFATLGLIVVVAALIIIAIIDATELGDIYWRLLGVGAILDVLGTITVAALQKFVPDQNASTFEPEFGSALDSRIGEAAKSRGVSRTQLVSDALDSLLGPKA